MTVSRFLNVGGARNFRDFGGYAGEPGTVVARGRLFRSNKLSELDDEDRTTLDGLGLRAVFDLRSSQERDADPTAWSQDGVEFHTFRPGHKRRLVDMAAEYPATLDGVRDLMTDFYAEMPFTMAHVFGAIIREIAAGATPCLIHCSAGKDRTGLAVALIQACLGVSRADIVADYVLTDARPRPVSDMARALAPGVQDGTFRSRYPQAAIEAMMSASPAYISAALDAIDRRCGSISRYVGDVLTVDDDIVAALRRGLLGPSLHEGAAA